jgi:hypothetical protein
MMIIIIIIIGSTLPYSSLGRPGISQVKNQSPKVSPTLSTKRGQETEVGYK